jgi:acetylornithine deacetylase/succinyl-diaminopimelate desuccinylase-like protein
MKTARALKYAQHNQMRFVKELREFARFPSVSAQDEYRAPLQSCAAWLAAHLRNIGFERARIIRTRRHPLVYAAWRQSSRLPTLLIYGHYDVQPPEPLAEWQSAPFAPVVKNNYLYGRGVSDDKGQMFALIKSLESYLQTGKALPVNVKCIFEGEEEIGSPGFTAFLANHRDALQAEVAVVSDTSILAPDKPAITYALRGALSLELEIRGAAQDLHSGNFGGAIHNPAQVLCEIIAQLHDADGRIRIPGFYDRVQLPEARERRYLARVGATEKEILEDAGARAGWGEQGFTLYERMTLRPALSVVGLTGGYQGQGTKAIIPARASAKLNFRLVGDQDPEEIARRFREHLARLTPPTVSSLVKTQLAVKPVVINLKNPFTRAAIAAYQKGFGASPVFVRSGGTIPPVSALRDVLDIPVMMLGFALPDDHLHAPNERFYLPNFYKGIAAGIWFLDEIARVGGVPAGAPPSCSGRSDIQNSGEGGLRS